MINLKCPSCTYPLRLSGNAFKCDNCGKFILIEKTKNLDKKEKKKIIN